MVTEGKRWDVKRRSDDEVPKFKFNHVKEIVDLAKNNKVLGIVRITGIPGAQFQQMRKNLTKGVTMKVVRNNLLFLGLKEVLGDIPVVTEFLGEVEGQTALIATDLDPFRLYRQLEATKTKSPAKGGEVAPDDILVEEGETEFKAGPIVGDLQKVGIPAGIVSGKVVIKSTKTLVGAGGVISKPLAIMLTRLNIFPLTVGLDLKAALEEGIIYRKDVLAVDDELIMSQITSGAANAFNLAMFIAYPTKATTKLLIAKAHGQALNLAIEAMVLNKESVGPLVAKAAAQALALKTMVEGGAPEAGPPKEGPAKDEKPEKEKKSKEEAKEDAAAGLGSLFGD